MGGDLSGKYIICLEYKALTNIQVVQVDFAYKSLWPGSPQSTGFCLETYPRPTANFGKFSCTRGWCFSRTICVFFFFCKQGAETRHRLFSSAMSLPRCGMDAYSGEGSLLLYI